jgi:hypothetical protein
MKKVKTMLECLKALLKKNFFNNQKTDINHNCKNVFNFDLGKSDFNAKNETEEYLNNYKSTTRWQTV